MFKNLTVYICDDDIHFAYRIRKEFEKCFKEKAEYKVAVFDSGNRLIEQWNNEIAEVVFLDIDMPDKNGFEIAENIQKLDKNAVIIFVTSYEEKVFQCWEYQPFWFIRKSHMYELELIADKLIAKLTAIREQKNHTYNLIAENSVVEIDFNTTKYISSYRHYIIINYKERQPQQVRCKISDAERQLEKLFFVRAQNGVLVNLRFVSKISSREIILTTGETISVGRNKLDYVKSEFQRYIRSK